jgi:hypothetical protein
MEPFLFEEYVLDTNDTIRSSKVKEVLREVAQSVQLFIVLGVRG